MTKPERLAESDKEPIVCPSQLTPSGTPLLLAEYDRAFLYLWCRVCRRAHPIRLKDLHLATLARVEEQLAQP